MAESVAVSQDVAEETFANSMNEFTKQIRDREFREQAIYFLNAFWTEIGNKQAIDGEGNDAVKSVKIVEKTGVRYEDQKLTWPMQIYEWVKLMTELSHDSKGSDMHSLDESGGGRFLEMNNRAKTALARRAMLKQVDIDCDNRMSMFEWLLACEQLFDTTKTAFSSSMSIQQRFHELMTRKQGTNEELEKAQALLDLVLEEIAAIEAAIKKQEAILEGEGGIVTKNRARNEIEQIQSKYPSTELNRKLITAEAAVRAAAKGVASGEGGVLAGAKWYLEYELDLAQKYKPSSSK